MSRHIWKTFVILSFAGTTPFGATALAAGFAVHEQSAASQGNAFAGSAAGGGDVSSGFFNPAALTRYPGTHVSGSFSVIFGNADFQVDQATTAFGNPTGGGDGGNLLKTGYVPAFSGSWEFSPDWFLGLSVNAPFGFETEGDEGWAGRYYAYGSKVRAVEIAPQLAWKASDWLAFGASFRAMKFDARLSSFIDIGTLSGGLLAAPGTAAADSLVSVKGDDWAYGYSLGVLITPEPDTRLGIGYRSMVNVALQGTADFTLSTQGQILSGLSGALVDTGARAGVKLPETVTIGLEHDLSPKWTIGAEADYTRWSRFNTLTVQFDNPAQPDDITNEGWRNSWFLSLGAAYKMDDDWTFRFGAAYDEGVIPSANLRGPRIPDSDRYWASTGASYKINEMTTLNGAYTHVFSPEVDVNQTTADPTNANRGNLVGSIDGSADIVSLGLSMTF